MTTKDKKAKTDQDYLDKLRHSCAHLLAAAVLEIYPDAKLAIGPSIKEGFYYDIDFGETKVGNEQLPKIEKRMHKLITSWKGFEKKLLTAKEAKAHYKNDNPYKTELIDEFSKGGSEKIGFYESAGSVSKAFDGKPYSDLCKGGHVENPSKEIKFFKLLKVAGAYWRGDEKNKMLTRIYGTAFPSQKELDNYLTMLEKAKKRDHKKIGKELDLFLFHETSPGCPYWLDKGLTILNELLEYWRVEHKKRGYKETATPLVNKKKLWETSGHWDHYKNDMFIANMGENEEYGIKPMNCPNAMIIFESKSRSYKELPLRLGDSDMLHRYERSGTLNGLFRVRSFRQDDSHNFITESQIQSEYREIFEITKQFYGVFELEFSFRLGTRPEKFMGDKKTWNKAESELKEILEESNMEYTVLEGDGAFYGPKVDILMKDALGREWQMGTIQLDFQIPKNFNLKYVDKDGSKKTPVVIHRVIYGSLERFIGILIEHFVGAFPVWISPIQVMILPITNRNTKYAKKISKSLMENGMRTELDDSSETLGNKIRKAQSDKVPYMLILGDKEEKTKKVAVRLRSGEDLGQMSLEKITERVLDKIKKKSLDL